ncbi:DUF222 domain-containing protein [Microbacterium sp.]|uniref:HNH endonuclease signature motif containing protein n=1 Tax=Microbacterium sp. TaxID=51671 RepID=UPI0039E33BDF
MALFTDVASLIPTLGERLGEHASLGEATRLMAEMADADVVAILRESAEVSRFADQVRVVAAGLVAERSTRAAGQSGCAQSRGHRTPAGLVQELSGSTRSEAARDVRVGQSLLDGERGGREGPGIEGADASARRDADDGVGGAGDDREVIGGSDAGASQGLDTVTHGEGGSSCPLDWRQPLRDGLRHGVLASAQFDAIARGLGDPPEPPSGADGSDGSGGAGDAGDADEGEVAAIRRAIAEAWFLAAEQLVGEAGQRTVEELGSAARTIRDLLDPEGAEARFLARHEKRMFRRWRDADGVMRGSIAFDDEGAAFIDMVFEAALRPRRGGPRFVDSEEAERAKALIDDARTNDQLAYDLLLDLVRGGVLADAEDVLGARQAGVRLVQVRDATGAGASVVHTEDGVFSFPAASAGQRICESGVVEVTVDSFGNPLDVGREKRLFTPRQRIGLAIRDGGCRWRGCDRPASTCEAHHIDEWHADAGRTDIDRGILLCRFHHMQLHHGGWRITREGLGDFVLRHRDGEKFVLPRRAALTYAWAGIDPPPKRFRPAA